MSWLSDLGEKSSRTDVWVFLITVMFVGCLTNVWECHQSWYLDVIVMGMFADLGINTIANKFGKS